MALKKTLLHSKFALPTVVLVVGAALSLGLGWAAHQEISRGADTRFDAVAHDAARKVEDRFGAYTEVLVGLRALFNTSETVPPVQFAQYVAALDLSTHHPGFQVLNYAPAVLPAARPDFEKRLGRAIDPPVERDEYHPIALIEPRSGNEPVVGRDLGAVPVSLKALQHARDTGEMTSSGRKIKIRGNASHVGLAVRLPVYRAGLPVRTVEERRAAYLGSVGAGLGLDGMMRGIVPAHAAADELPRIRLYDAGPAAGQRGALATPVLSADKLLYDSAGDAAEPGPAFERTLAFDLAGRSWMLHVSQDRHAVVGWLDRAVPWFIALCGLAISALIASVVVSLTTSRSRAQAIATSMTRHLRTSERQLEEAQHLANLGSWILDLQTGRLECSDEARRILGLPDDAACTGLASLLSRVPPAERAAVDEHIAIASRSSQRREFEHRLSLPDGNLRSVHVIVQQTDEDGRSVLRGTLRDDTQRHKSAMRLKLEHELARLLVSDGEQEVVIARALETVCTHLEWDCGSFWFVQENGLVRCGAAWHVAGHPAVEEFARISRTLTYRFDEGSLGRAWVDGEAVTVDASTAAGDDCTRDALARQAGLEVGLIVPTLAGGRSSAIEFFSRKPHALDAEAIESLHTIALQIGQYEQRKRTEQILRYVASHDALTGLPNRTALQRDLVRGIKRSVRHQKRMAVMFIDIDRFKQINDTLGHGAGDAMLQACAKRLTTVLRAEDAVARFGGDEFVLVLENLSKASDAAVVADKVLACCAEPFLIDGRELHVTASIGVSVYPDDGTDSETLLKNADTAMYRAKDKGRGGYQFYAAQMNAQGTERLMLECGLRHAVERGELALHYQPKMDLRTQRIVGVEALMRWRHPVLGMVSPAQFIPIAEETGLIVAMGKWALQTACAEAVGWQARGLPPVQMSVNLSPRQLNSPTLIGDIAQILASTRLDPALLELEITEGLMMQNPEHAAALFQQVRDMGVGLAIDDFGTGYSSLSYLKRFPLTTVKIDRSFVNDLPQDADAQALTTGIVTLAHGLRMKVVAEGVETAAQLDYLRANGCDEIQGYHLCRPVASEDVCKFMARHLRNAFDVPAAA
ncbi:bifunctional diguanylate cyclase/phosphodiesterase [Piscinibacter sp.]|uniref:bifunctional diguanylate cyclase/phosphodiesterase n=1 Tax=Piscinibacter sp. TaxID=1903157 RepID=UPI002B6B3B6C|nr:EAL domain-containing protein [Albitalea sp.]HUG26082.1 EAL domain-containing protein [Albitalea sp.]